MKIKRYNSTKKLRAILDDSFTSKTDVLGSWCGNVKGNPSETPTQDADDL